MPNALVCGFGCRFTGVGDCPLRDRLEFGWVAGGVLLLDVEEPLYAPPPASDTAKGERPVLRCGKTTYLASEPTPSSPDFAPSLFSTPAARSHDLRGTWRPRRGVDAFIDLLYRES